MSTKAELACIYAALILADDDVAVTGEKIQTILKAAGVEVESYWPGLFAKALEGVSIKDLIANVGSAVGVAPVAAAAGGAPAAGGGAAPATAAPAEKKEEKKKVESESESDDDMGFGLFD